MKRVNVELYNRTAYFEGNFAKVRLCRYFQFHPKNYNHMPLYKDGKWDGYIKLFNRRYNCINSGLFLALKDEIEERERIRFVIRDFREGVKFDDDVDILSDRIYQNLGVRALQMARSGGILLSATATGKTRIAGHYFKTLIGTACFIVDELTLLDQARRAFEKLLGEKIGMVGDQVFDPQRITVATIQTMHKHRKKRKFSSWIHGLDVLFIDEVHEALNNRNIEVIKTIKPALVFGLTATLELQKESVRIPAYSLCGPVIFEYYQEEATREGHIAPAIVCSVRVVQEGGLGGYHSEYRDLITESRTRNRCIVKLVEEAHRRGKHVVVICDRVKHLGNLSEALSHIRHKTVYGAKKTPERIRTKGRFEKGKIRLIICNKVFKKGVDIRAIDFIIECSGLYGKNDAQQKLGRGKRLKEGKAGLIYADINDRSPRGVKRDDLDWNRFERNSKSRLSAFRKRKIPIIEVEWKGNAEEIVTLAQAKLDRFVRRLKLKAA